MKKRKGVLEVGSQSWLLSGGWDEMASQTGVARTEQQWHPLLCGNWACVPGADVGRWLELRDEAAGQRAGPLGLIFAKEMSCQDVKQGQCLI